MICQNGTLSNEEQNFSTVPKFECFNKAPVKLKITHVQPRYKGRGSNGQLFRSYFGLVNTVWANTAETRALFKGLFYSGQDLLNVGLYKSEPLLNKCGIFGYDVCKT